MNACDSRWRQKGQRFKVIFTYIHAENWRLAQATGDLISNKTKRSKTFIKYKARASRIVELSKQQKLALIGSSRFLPGCLLSSWD